GPLAQRHEASGAPAQADRIGREPGGEPSGVFLSVNVGGDAVLSPYVAGQREAEREEPGGARRTHRSIPGARDRRVARVHVAHGSAEAADEGLGQERAHAQGIREARIARALTLGVGDDLPRAGEGLLFGFQLGETLRLRQEHVDALHGRGRARRHHVRSTSYTPSIWLIRRINVRSFATSLTVNWNRFTAAPSTPTLQLASVMFTPLSVNAALTFARMPGRSAVLTRS